MGSLQQRHCFNLIHQPFLEPLRLSPKICFPLPNLFTQERKSSPKMLKNKYQKSHQNPGTNLLRGDTPNNPWKEMPPPPSRASRASLLSRLSKKVTARPGTPARPVRPMRWMWSSGPGLRGMGGWWGHPEFLKGDTLPKN